MKNLDVIKAWMRGLPARGGNLRTDGGNLYSYNLRIGYVVSPGYRVVIPYRAGTQWGFVSQTTSKHVGLALRYADALEP